jgi:hypothetical protein
LLAATLGEPLTQVGAWDDAPGPHRSINRTTAIRALVGNDQPSNPAMLNYSVTLAMEPVAVTRLKRDLRATLLFCLFGIPAGLLLANPWVWGGCLAGTALIPWALVSLAHYRPRKRKTDPEEPEYDTVFLRRKGEDPTDVFVNPEPGRRRK